MRYRIAKPLMATNNGVMLVGCGGTGAHVAEGLCRLLDPQISLVLVDHDRVEERNLVRQNYFRQDLGRFKAEVLAERLARSYGRKVAYSTSPFLNQRDGFYGSGFVILPHLIISCVDNAHARMEVSRAVNGRMTWWVDSGNGDTWGQVLVGNMTHRIDIGRCFNKESGSVYALPAPSLQRPTLLTAPPAPAPNCAEAVEQGDQSPTINLMMASLVLETVRRLLEGTCTWMGLSVDLEQGVMTATDATPENVARLLKMPQGSLMVQKRREDRRKERR